MLETKLTNVCDHRIVEPLIISGTYPNSLIARTTSPINPNHSLTKIIETQSVSELELLGYTTSSCTNYSFIEDYLSQTYIVFDPNNTYDPDDIATRIPNTTPGLNPKEDWIIVYSTLKEQCPKCRGTNIQKDILSNALGRFTTVSGQDKVRQEIWKIIVTLKGTNIFDPSYGAILGSFIGKKATIDFLTQIQYTIRQALIHLMEIQSANNVPANEQITNVSSVIVKQSPEDIRVINITITVVTASFQEVAAEHSVPLKS